MAIEKHGSAHWKGDLKTGVGNVSTETGVLNHQTYGFNTRFEGETGTNPEELIGAAHAACFSMALSMVLGETDLKADAIDTTATVTLDQVDGGFAITKIHLDVEARIPGADDAAFQDAATTAKENCPVSKALAGPDITMEARLA
ncbi:OsmC family peroxiredoxin [Rhodobacteraceae bacterium CCMM004]|nr:OsmC family peroxiredoxin [Rhodobacteraceae bacterium CCMM004]